VEQKDHFQSTLRKGLGGPSPVAFSLAEYGGTGTDIAPNGRVIGQDECEEGLLFYRGERYTFLFLPRPERGYPKADYCVRRVNSARDGLWSLRDHPHLALELLGMKRDFYPWVHPNIVAKLEADEYQDDYAYAVDEEAMRDFLHTYGPLTPSFLPPENKPVPGPMIDEMGHYLPDDRLKSCFGSFSRLVGNLHRVVRDANEDPVLGVVSCLCRIEEAPQRSLYRALLLQLLEHFLDGNPLHCCEGCGQWFSFTEDESEARHREGWKRSDARYHSRACLKAASERRRRARLREQGDVAA
jgi:hypothetical protein